MERSTQSQIRKVLRAFPRGFLSEETDQHEATAFHSKWPWNGSTSTSTNAADQAALPSLLALEAAVANAARGLSKPVPSERLAGWFDAHVTANGFLQCEPWQTFRALPALARLRTVLQKQAWTESIEQRFAALVAATLRTASGKGWLFNRAAQPSENYRALVGALTGERGLREWHNVPVWLWGAGTPKRIKPPHPGFYSEESKIAVLRRDWSRGGLCIAVDYRGPHCVLEVYLGGAPIIGGVWQTKALIEGQELSLTGDWRFVCWFSDEECEYLELSMPNSDGVQVDRQFFLTRELPQLWLVDTIRAPGAKTVELVSQLPIAFDLARQASTTAWRSAKLDTNLWLIPAGLPADPKITGSGSLTASKGKLELSCRAPQDRLFMPLVLTWSKEPQAPLPWRPLTITQDRRRLSTAEAVAYRVPIGAQQAIFYRSLVRPERCAFIGHQTTVETCIGRMSKAGTLEEWVVVEP